MRTISPGFIGGGRKRGWLPTSQTDIWGALGGGILSFPHKIVKMDQIFFSFFHTVKFDESVEMKTTRPRVEIQIFLNSCRWIVRMVGGGWVGILFSRWFYFTNFELLNRLTAVWKRNILQPPPPLVRVTQRFNVGNGLQNFEFSWQSNCTNGNETNRLDAVWKCKIFLKFSKVNYRRPRRGTGCPWRGPRGREFFRNWIQWWAPCWRIDRTLIDRGPSFCRHCLSRA